MEQIEKLQRLVKINKNIKDISFSIRKKQEIERFLRDYSDEKLVKFFFFSALFVAVILGASFSVFGLGQSGFSFLFFIFRIIFLVGSVLLFIYMMGELIDLSEKKKDISKSLEIEKGKDIGEEAKNILNENTNKVNKLKEEYNNIVNDFKLKDYSLLINNSETLNDEEMSLLENLFNKFKEGNLVERSKKLKQELVMAFEDELEFDYKYEDLKVENT